jgi:hypothetical protein
MDRMQKKLVVSPPPKAVPLLDNFKKRPSPDAEIKPKKVVKKPLLKPKNMSSDTSTKVIKVSKPAPRKKVDNSDSEDNFDFPDDDAGAAFPLSKAPPARARPARATAVKKPTVYNLSSDDEDDDSDAEFS